MGIPTLVKDNLNNFFSSKLLKFKENEKELNGQMEEVGENRKLHLHNLGWA